MVTQPPPSRYRVVEQGRTLVVIDARTGAPATHSMATGPVRPSSTLPRAPERTDFAGRSTLVTHALYDAKAPRTLQLDEGATRLVDSVRIGAIVAAIMLAAGGVVLPWLLIVPAVLFNPRVRAALRAPVTRWLDRYEAASAG